MAESCTEQKETQWLESKLSFSNGLVDEFAPFVHKFRTESQTYVYDVNTCRIIRVSQIVWDILDDIGRMDENEIIAKHSALYDPREISAAIKEISLAQEEKGLFLSRRPKEILPPRKEEIQERLNDKRIQLVLNVTENCNFRCSYCVFGDEYQAHRTHSAKKMSWETARAAIDDFLSHTSNSVNPVVSFYGGEPLLSLGLIQQCVSYVKQNYETLQVDFSLTTNGSLMEGKAAQFLADENFIILVSLDGPCEIHDRHRRTKKGEPTWKHVISNLQDFFTAFPKYKTNSRIRFSSVVAPTTDLCKVDEFWTSSDIFSDSMGLEASYQKEMGSSNVKFTLDDPAVKSRKLLFEKFIQRLKDGSIGQANDPDQWIMRACFDRPFVFFHKRGYRSKPLPEKMFYLNNCITGVRRTFVNADGNYYACERVLEAPEQNIGNVREGMDITKVMNLLENWVKSTSSQCRNCWCLNTCHAGCLANATDRGTITKEARNKTCKTYLHNSHFMLKTYCSVLEENPAAFDYIEKIVFE